MNANQIRRQDSNRASIVLFCVLLLTGAFGYMAYDLSNALLRDRSPFAQRKIETLSQQQYRFREIYHGPSTEAHHQGGGMTTGFASASSVGQSSSTRYGQSGSYSAVARPTAASTASAGSSAGGGALHTSSSQSAHSYGGGSSAGSMSGFTSNGSSNHSSLTSNHSSASYSAVSLPTYAYARKSAASSTTSYRSIASGPRRSHSDGVDGSYDGQDDGDGYIWSEADEGWIVGPATGTEREFNGIMYVWNGTTWRPKDGGHISDLGAPIGDMPIVLLMLLLAGYAVRRRRGSEDRILL